MAALHSISIHFQNVFPRLTFLLICAAALFAVSATLLAAVNV